MEKPHEYEIHGSDGWILACRLNKSVCRLKEPVYNWYKELTKFLLRQGLNKSRNDH